MEEIIMFSKIDKHLKRFYLFFLITGLAFILLFPNLFFGFNNIIDYFKIKTTLVLEKKTTRKIYIYEEKTNLLIIMDDGWESQYKNAYNYMKKYNIRGTIGIITNKVGDINYVNLAMCYDMYNSGWDLVNHTVNHKDLSSINYVNQEIEIAGAKKWLENKGFIRGIDLLIYPYGEYNKNTIKVMKKWNINGGRTTIEGFNHKYITNKYEVKVKNVYSDIKVEEVKKWIEKSIENNETIILLFHKIEKVSDNSGMQYDINKFQKIVDYMNKKKKQLNIITYSEWKIESSFIK